MQIKVYYEDTDAGGVVYYANYLKFFERSRTEYFKSIGVDLFELARNGILFTVARIEVDYKSPAILGDVINVLTDIIEVKRCSLTLRNRVVRESDGKLITSGVVTIVCVSGEMKVFSIPGNIKDNLISNVVKV